MSRKTYDTLERTLKRYYKQADITLRKENQASLKAIRDVLSDTYEQYGMDTEQLFAELQKYKRMDKLEKEIRLQLSILSAVSIKAVKQTLVDVFHETYRTTFNDIQKSTGLKGIQKKMNALETANQLNMGTVWTERLKNYSDKQANDILIRIREGIYKGDSYQSMTKELKETLGKNYNQTMRVVRTEGKRVVSECQLETFNQFRSPNLVIYKTWHNSQDGRVRDSHNSMEGVKIKHGEMFTMPNGTKQEAPAMGYSPSENINCRCYLSMDYELLTD